MLRIFTHNALLCLSTTTVPCSSSIHSFGSLFKLPVVDPNFFYHVV
jgi:hypothetical protein